MSDSAFQSDNPLYRLATKRDANEMSGNTPEGMSVKLEGKITQAEAELEGLKEQLKQVSEEVKALEEKRRSEGKLSEDDKGDLKYKRQQESHINERIIKMDEKIIKMNEKITQLSKEKTQLSKEKTQLSKEKTQLSKERTATLNARANAPLWDVLSQIPQRAVSRPGGTNTSKRYQEENGKSPKTGGGKLTETKGWPFPHMVKEKIDLAPPELEVSEDSPWFNKVPNEKFPNVGAPLQCSTEAAVGNVLSQFLVAVLLHGRRGNIFPENLDVWSEQPCPKHGFRPDFVLENGTDGYVLVIELKPEWKWGVEWDKTEKSDDLPVDTIAWNLGLGERDESSQTYHWKLGDLKDLKTGEKASPIRQQLTYMLGLRLRYGVLTTYTHWWFLEYRGGKKMEEMTLYTSRPIAFNKQAPSMARYLARHVAMSCGEERIIPDEEIPDEVLEQLGGWKEFKENLRGFRGDGKESGDGGGGGSGSSNHQSNSGDDGGAAGGSDSPSNSSSGAKTKKKKNTKKKKKSSKNKKDQKDDSSSHRKASDRTTDNSMKDNSIDDPIITSTLGSSRTGVTWKVDYLGYTSVVKVADVFKQPFLVEELEQEREVYGVLSTLQGTAIPKFVGLCDFQCGRLGLATLYAGENLNKFIEQTSCDHAMRLSIAEKCLSQLDLIHALKVHHGDIRPENIVVGEDGTPRFIDFALSDINGATGGEYAGERWRLVAMLKDELNLGSEFDIPKDNLQTGASGEDC